MDRRTFLGFSGVASSGLAASVPMPTNSAPVTHARTAAEVAGGVVPADLSYPAGPQSCLERYGGRSGTGSGSANSAAIASVLKVFAATGTKGGVIQFDRGDYEFNEPIALSYLWGITLRGTGGVSGGAVSGTRLIYTGSGARFIDMRGALGVHLQDLAIEFSNPAFTGALVDAGNDGQHDSFRCSITRCNLGASIGRGCVHIDLLKAIEFVADQCHFLFGNPSISGRDAKSYSNVVTFRDCTWTNSRSTPVVHPGHTWAFRSCTFEQLRDGSAGAIDSGGAPFSGEGLTVDSCWFGDVTAASGTWIRYSGHGLNVRGCFFGGIATSTQAISLESVSGFVIEGNRFNRFLNCLNFEDDRCAAGSFRYNSLYLATNAIGNASAAPSGHAFDSAPNEMSRRR
jgi:hypothetical protein